MARVRGSGGELRVGYQYAGAVGPWTLETSPRADGRVDIALTATDATLDPYWSTQRPLSVALRMGRRVWCWPNVTVHALCPLTCVMVGGPEVL